MEVLESSPQVAIRVSRTDDGISATSVGYATSDGTARAGEDYVGAEGRLDFGPGVVEQTLVIPLLNDGRREPTEYFQVTLNNPASGFSLGSIRTVRVDVEDNDPGVRFSQPDYWLSEDGGTVTLVVERGSDATAPITAELRDSGRNGGGGRRLLGGLGGSFPCRG